MTVYKKYKNLLCLRQPLKEQGFKQKSTTVHQDFQDTVDQAESSSMPFF